MKADVSKTVAKRCLEGMEEAIIETLSAGEKVQLTGFGSFRVTSRKARTGRNPKTGVMIKIPAHKAPLFSAGKSLKNALQ